MIKYENMNNNCVLVPTCLINILDWVQKVKDVTIITNVVATVKGNRDDRFHK